MISLREESQGSRATVHERPYLPVLHTSELTLDQRDGSVVTPDGTFHLAPMPAEVLAFLMKRPGVPFRDVEIMYQVWGGHLQDWGGDKVRIIIRRIRKAIGAAYIVTRHGYGYLVR